MVAMISMSQRVGKYRSSHGEAALFGNLQYITTIAAGRQYHRQAQCDKYLLHSGFIFDFSIPAKHRIGYL